MNTTTKTGEVLLEDVLYEFSLSWDGPDRALLETFIKRYPEYAKEITDLSVELGLDALREELAPKDTMQNGDPNKVSTAVSRAMSHFQNMLYAEKQAKAENTGDSARRGNEVSQKINSMLVEQYREFADKIGVNTTFTNKYRDHAIDPETIPKEFSQSVAEALDEPLEFVIAFNGLRPDANSTQQYFKADAKPNTRARQSFRDAAKSSGLNEEQQRRLLGLK